MVPQNQYGVGIIMTEKDQSINISSFETKGLDYLEKEKSFLLMNIIIPVLFVIGQSLELIIIFSTRPIIPPEIRGFVVINIMILLILTNIFYYIRFQKAILHYNTSEFPKLSMLLYQFNTYKKRVTFSFYLLCGLSILYAVVYFAGFILLQLSNTVPMHPRGLDPILGSIMTVLIYLSFILQVIYLLRSWGHISRWRASEQKLKALEHRVYEELDLNFSDLV